MPELEKIALLNFGGLGDELLFTPVVRAVRQAYPDAHITLVLESRSARIREVLPEVNTTFEINLAEHSRVGIFIKLWRMLSKGHFDAVISSGSSPFIPMMLFLTGIPIRIGFDTGILSHTLLSATGPLNRQTYAGDMYFSLARAFLSYTQADFQSASITPLPTITLDSTHITPMKALLNSIESKGPHRRVMIHPGVSRMSIEKNILKSWPVSSWQGLLVQLTTLPPDVEIYLLGGPDDAEVLQALLDFCQTLNPQQQNRIHSLYGKTQSFKDLAALIKLADVLVSVDSAPMHLAVATKTPIVAIFSPTDPVKLLPVADWTIPVMRTDLPCRPCLWDHRKTSCDTPLCLDVEVQTVFQSVQRMLNTHIPTHLTSV